MNTGKEISENIKLLIISYLQGKCTDAEKLRFEQWLFADESNFEYFNALKASWVLADKASGRSRFDENKLWNSLHTRMTNPGKKNRKFIYNEINFKQIARIAASWLIVFLLGSSLSFWLAKRTFSQNSQLTSINSPLGSKSHVLLPDGSSVWLNAGSTLEYNVAFNSKTREVKLVGEAFFDVTTNKSKPFIVNAQNVLIKAFGTQFNVKAYTEEKKVVTTLVEGNVKIEGKDDLQRKFTINLEPKQKVTCYINEMPINNGKAQPAEVNGNEKNVNTYVPLVSELIPVSKDINVNTEIYTSWKDKRWIISGEKFKDLAFMLERRFNVSIVFSSAELYNYRFSGILENETPEQVLEILRLTMPIDYKIDKGHIHIGIDKKLKEKYKRAY